MREFVLRVTCEDQRGLLAAVSSTLADFNLNILSNHEFVDVEAGRFFMRSVFEGEFNEQVLLQQLKQRIPVQARLEMSALDKRKIVLMATREAHVLGDLLIRHRHEDLNANILAVVANHDDLRSLTESFDIPFHHVDAKCLSREEHEEAVLDVLNSYDLDYLVLAKYMRILSPQFVNHFPRRILNIHHSFLPAFVGANPYRQAFDRGVKIIGATAHFVNEDLDEGPIIAQGVESVDHRLDAKGLARVGRDIEKSTLARALELVLQQRVFICGRRTVVF